MIQAWLRVSPRRETLVDLIEALRRDLLRSRHHSKTLRPIHCLCSPLHTELYKQALHVRLHRLGRDAEQSRDFLVRLASANELENVTFAWAQDSSSCLMGIDKFVDASLTAQGHPA